MLQRNISFRQPPYRSSGGTWLWGVLHLPMIANFWISAIVISTVGACILLFIIRLVRR